ncbi:helix-turn-helix domain-containing protein [Micromonospora sp. A3M-1-15]|uniref:winged helix-turn-helix domain-containing protein n=1 Tax=Micromonospora sp. A3M-1-15 TaxID=2962035 RepID=UPI0020B73949|nr:helix-turn-helix domain-containing protein [Micromonospora sp. A3M-1-15]MCP3781796.1 helix-turn-helix domain-containing protein [Micromonospora sp. A3M-1-15]
MTEQRSREITDVDTLRAFAHPLRLRILDAVGVHGPLTATEVAERVGESPANCSWHLRQLAKYGFVTEAGGGTGRQRPWRLVTDGHQWGNGEESPELARAGDAAARVLLDLEYRKLWDWMAARRQQSPEWRDAGFFSQFVSWYTADELQELQEELRALLARHLDRLADPTARPPGSRPVRLMAWGVPEVDGPTVTDTDTEGNGER